MLLCDVVDQLHDDDRLADACAAEQTDLAALCERCDQIDDLDAGFEDLGRGLLLLIGRSGTVDRPALLAFDRRLVVYRLTEKVEDTAEVLVTDRNGDRAAGIGCLHAAHQAVGGLHRDAAHGILTDMLRNLDRDDMAVVVDRDGVQQLGQRVSGKFNVKHRSGDLDNGADILLTHWQNSL